MKTKSLDCARPTFPKSCSEEIDLTVEIERYKRNHAPHQTGITFIGSESEFEEIGQSLPFKSRCCPSLHLLLRSGLYQESTLFILIGPSASADQTEIERILSARSPNTVKVITLEEGANTDKSSAILQAARKIEFAKAKNSITENILDRSRRLEPSNELSANERGPKQNRRMAESSSIDEELSEEEFRSIISKKLKRHLESSPEEILSKAIEVIKR